MNGSGKPDGVACHQSTSPFREGDLNNVLRQVFWLSDHSSDSAFPLNGLGRFAVATVEHLVPDYSGGTATDLHRLPFSSATSHESTTRQSHRHLKHSR